MDLEEVAAKLFTFLFCFSGGILLSHYLIGTITEPIISGILLVVGMITFAVGAIFEEIKIIILAFFPSGFTLGILSYSAFGTAPVIVLGIAAVIVFGVFGMMMLKDAFY
ncbi:MAG: hypothetical protein JSV43_00475 [Methanobacteriota archaeon]|nr:MAG: hypothetical protein JSV43_00475 [Euryarchaeota archaeon]